MKNLTVYAGSLLHMMANINLPLELGAKIKALLTSGREHDGFVTISLDETQDVIILATLRKLGCNC